MPTVDELQAILVKKLSKAVQQLPTILGNEAVNHSLDAFKEQAWEGQQWRRRIYRKKQGPTILVKTGIGRRSIRVISKTAKGFVYGTDVKYMAAHNDGFTGTVTVAAHTRNKFAKSKTGTGKFTKSGKERTKTISSISGSVQVKSHTRKMNLPRRRFAGKTQSLLTRLNTVAKNHLLKAMQS